MVSKNWQIAGDIFQEMSAFQGQLAELFTAYEERSGSPRVKLLIGLLTARARQCEMDLADYVRDMPMGLKQTRVQFRVSQTPRSLLGALCDVAEPTVDDVTAVSVKSDAYFAQTFEGLIATAEANGQRKLKKIYENMWELEQEAQKSLARQISSLRDL
ncbi:MAG: hypothetical protein GKS06_14565 [Acidobacteria bacterium]|nr:hypothetical protein [Acidobacteriota bacterium]